MLQKSLAVTLGQILDELPFAPDGRIALDAHFRHSLEEATKLYASSREDALSQLYQSKELTKERPAEVEADFEEVAASCGYFSFSLQDFANEMKTYLEILDDLKLEVEERPKGRTWKWIKIWNHYRDFRARQPTGDPGKNPFIVPSILVALIISTLEQDSSAEGNRILESVPSPTERKSTPNCQSDEHSRKWSYRYRLWRALSILRRDDIKFAVKVGIGAALYALPSFLEASRPFFRRWRGEWGLLSYMLVCSMTIGASNTTGFARFFGTCLGAVCAILSWTISRGNVYLLAFFGWLMSYWTAYIIVAQKRGPLGRFIMLTYNLSALFAYSLSVEDTSRDSDEGGVDPVITEIAVHRVVAVLSG